MNEKELLYKVKLSLYFNKNKCGDEYTVCNFHQKETNWYYCCLFDEFLKEYNRCQECIDIAGKKL